MAAKNGLKSTLAWMVSNAFRRDEVQVVRLAGGLTIRIRPAPVVRGKVFWVQLSRVAKRPSTMEWMTVQASLPPSQRVGELDQFDSKDEDGRACGFLRGKFILSGEVPNV